MTLPVCPQHGCHPHECFYIHYPEAEGPGETPDSDAHTQALIEEHIRRQQARIREAQHKHDRTVVEAKGRFEERRKGA